MTNEIQKGKVSVIITLYNLGQYIEECLDSIGDVSALNAEIIVVNDGSTESATLSVLEELRTRSDIRVIEQENGGVASARNTGIQAANGEYILSVDADNRVNSEYIVKARQILEKDPKVGMVYSDLNLFGEADGLRELKDFDPGVFLAVNYIDNCAVFRRECWEKAGGYDSNMPYTGYEDWEMWINVFSQGYQISHIKEPLYDYRVREGSMISGTNLIENRLANFRYLHAKHSEVYAKHHPDSLDHLIKNLSEIEWELTQSVRHGKELSENFELEKGRLMQQLIESGRINAELNQRIEAFERSLVVRFKKRVKVLVTRFKSNSEVGYSNGMIRRLVVAFSRKSRRAVQKIIALVFKHLYLMFEPERVVIVDANAVQGGAVMSQDPLHRLLERNKVTESVIIEQRKQIDSFAEKPLLSILMPVYNPPIEFFIKAVESLQRQSYEFWELCLADDCSTDPDVKKTIEELKARDPRIKVVYREENGHISAASNSAMELAEGEFFVLMDQDDELAIDALFWCVKAINDNEGVDMIYTDEDKIDEMGQHSEGHFKPDWSPDNLLSRNYLGHLTVFRASVFREIGGWRLGFEGSQDYDLVLRFTEACGNIVHIPKVLYHWRIHSASAAGGEEAKPYAYTAAQRALTEALERRGYKPHVGFLDGFRGYSVRLELLNPKALVSIIIPTKDKADILGVCLESIFGKSTWQNLEAIVLDNNSEEKETFLLFDKWQKAEPERFKVVRTEEPFNFSFLMNLGRQHSKGEFLILLNNDTEVIAPDWIESMMEHAQRPEVGVVGAKLLYPNDTIQHAGVIVGLGGVAGHVLVGEHRLGPGYFNYVNLLNNYSAVTAACVMVRTEVFDEVEGFNENFAVEYNDVDFCLKVWDEGYRNLYVPHCELYHHESISRGHPHLTKESLELHKAEIQKFKDRWQKYIDHDPCYNPNLSLGAHDFRMRD